MNGWLFQGNPLRFNVDKYLARQPQLVYWRTTRYASQVGVGDKAYIWRGGKLPGIVASGRIIESPAPPTKLAYPEMLGSDLWKDETEDGSHLQSGIQLNDLRLGPDDGMISKDQLLSHDELQELGILKNNRPTVFKLNSSLVFAIESLLEFGFSGVDSLPVVIEGATKIVSHRIRERSTWMRHAKIEQVRALTGKLSCEICGLSEDSGYPSDMAARIFEVHHLVPLGNLETATKTTLDDLTLLCANCHRAVHTTENVAENYKRLLASWG